MSSWTSKTPGERRLSVIERVTHLVKVPPHSIHPVPLQPIPYISKRPTGLLEGPGGVLRKSGGQRVNTGEGRVSLGKGDWLEEAERGGLVGTLGRAKMRN